MMKRNSRRWIQAVTLLAVLSIAGMERQARSEDVPAGWLGDWKEAEAKSRETGKPILAMFSAVWCAPCTAMKQEVFPKEVVQTELKNWIPVYIDEADDPETTEKFKILGYPTFVFVAPDGKEMDRYMGAVAHNVFAKVAIGQRKLPAAKAKVEAAPEDALAWKELADAYYVMIDVAGDAEQSKSRTELAIKTYERAMYLDPKNETGAAEVPYFLNALPKEFSGLAESFKKLAEFGTKFPNSELLPEVTFYRGAIARDLNKLDEAKAILTEGIEKFPTSDYAEGMKAILASLTGAG